MAANDPPLNEPFDIPDGPIPAVDPADLRSVWEMQREILARTGGGAILSNELYKRACSSGANVEAVWCRTSMLGALEVLGVLAPWIHDGVVSDAVFKVAATFPMKDMPIGVPQELDVDGFLTQVAASKTEG